MIRQIARVVFSGILMGAFVSCWDNFEEQTYYSANVLSFSFAEQDTCPGIEDYTFYIDQFNGLIYNSDSLPFGSKVDYLVPSITVQSTNGQLYINDSLWESTDTLDFTHPVRLTNTSSDGRYTRHYTIYVNVHQVDPDTMLVEEKSTGFPAVSYRNKVFLMEDGTARAYFPSADQGFEVYQADKGQNSWSRLPVSGLARGMEVYSLCSFKNAYFALDQTGLLYRSTNGLDWSLEGNSLRFKALYGSLNRQYKSDPNPVYLVGLLEDSAGAVRFAKSADGNNWITGDEIDSDFPVVDAGLAKGTTPTGIQFLTVGGGLRTDGSLAGTIWSTQDGLNWIPVTDDADCPLFLLKGVNLFYYHNLLVCLGGLKADGSFSTEIYVSKNHGLKWSEAADKWVIPYIQDGLAYGSTLVEHVADAVNGTDREFIWHWGGKTAGGTSQTVWKAYEYQMVFARR